MDINLLLQQNNINKVLIVDDAFDLVPLPTDLTLEEDEWIGFFNDVNQDEVSILNEIFPTYEGQRADLLPANADFVKALWINRNRFREAIVQPIFSRYEEDSLQHLKWLESLTTSLTSYGLVFETKGRDFVGHAADSDLIIIDLFLGSNQTNHDNQQSINGLKQIINNRSDNPPLVILMSNSPHLHEMRVTFRDATGLYESGFRFIEKTDIEAGHQLQVLLSRLALQFAGTQKLNTFVNSWKKGMNSAAERVSSSIKRLSLSDISQIQQLLLNAEGEPIGSYLVDVFDKSLQFEVESEITIIDAAKSLNELNVIDFPAPYIPESPNLLALVFRSLFQSASRLGLSDATGGRVFFGDILRRVPRGRCPSQLKEIGKDDVIVVLTPACDLQRPDEGAKRVMFMVGELQPFTLEDWRKEGDSSIRTPVIELSNGSRYWIKWKHKHIETFSFKELEKFLDESNPKLQIIARVRESHALELQQKLLSSMGRVGLIAPLPASMPMSIEAYVTKPDKTLLKLDLPELPHPHGTCYSGRAKGQFMQLVMTDQVCEEIQKAVLAFDNSQIHPFSKDIFEYLQNSTELSIIGKGIDLPDPGSAGLKTISSPNKVMIGEPDKPKLKPIGLVRLNPDETPLFLNKQELSIAGIVLVARNI